MKLKLLLPMVALFGQILGCSYDAAPQAFEGNLDDANHVIYGDYSMEELPKEQPYRGALVSLFERKTLQSLKTGQIYRVDEKFGGQELPWAEQSSASYCSGILVAPDMVLTAGHCLSSPYSCENLQLVFNYNIMNDSQEFEVRDCKAVVKTVVDVAGKGLDYALLQISEPVQVDMPEVIERPLSVGEKVYALGDPLGSYKKKSSGEVRSLLRTNGIYETTLDVFEGNSGSPVFSSKGDRLVGILSSGERDFSEDGGVKICGVRDCSGELVIPWTKILEDSKK
ncbi:hypothetical protein AZI86_16790 [Bdellovibrio bacteriovorus]|uniref:Serine protease n=1 Tax=Bdellovibrio bacteriovorus TaxID=959 RepID=A0A150WHF0_BDEBC|nr:serine protease [Bdellovibrio bacteriovorus]KYG62489.1 hypothetical protein AZI86_16790 [Bdellovibrio bacteriovorus]